MLLLHAKVARDGYPPRRLVKADPMRPKLAGLRSAAEKLLHGVDARADELAQHFATAEQQVAQSFAAAHAKIDRAVLAPLAESLAEVHAAIDEIDRLGNDPPAAAANPTPGGSSEPPGQA